MINAPFLVELRLRGEEWGWEGAEMTHKIVAQNRKARHDYFILDTRECGIVLTGTEIKSVRAGNLNLKDSYASIEKSELWLVGLHISPY